MRIFLSGAAGSLGSHLVENFLLNGRGVIIGLEYYLTGSQRYISDLSCNLRFSFIEQDVITPINITKRLDAILQFASPASPNATSGAVLMASTSEIYGDPLEYPQKDAYLGHVDRVGQRSVYDEAKRFAESLTIAFHRTNNLVTRNVRILNTYDSRMRLNDGRIIPNFILQALKVESLTICGDGNQIRGFCYVIDLINGIVKLLLSNETTPVNLRNSVELSMLKFAQTKNHLIGNNAGIEYKEGVFLGHDPQRRRSDITKAHDILDWHPVIALEEGLLRTIEYFRQELAL